MPQTALVLFDIDGTLLRKAGPHHREALIAAVRRVTGLITTTDNVPVAGMLDRDILRAMLIQAGAKQSLIQRSMPALVLEAQRIYVRTCPDLRRKVCPGARGLLYRLSRRKIPAVLVTGNLTRIGWRKMERAGLREYFSFGAFAELAKDRAGLARLAIQHARKQNWIGPGSPISLIGDHPNDIRAARANGIRAVAVGTGIIGMEELKLHSPDLLVNDMRELNVDQLL
jgi:phosphoglycolate phosphatase